MKIIGIMLAIVGALMAFFVRAIIKHSIIKIKSDDGEDDDFAELLTLSAMVFKIIGFGIVIVGVIIIFVYS